MRSICASSMPPSFGSAATLAGQFEKRSVPTSRAQAPSAQTLSVSDGSRLTMRCGGAASVTVTPRSSRTASCPRAERASSVTTTSTAKSAARGRAPR